MGWPRSKPHHRAQPWIEWGVGRGAQQGEDAILCSRVQGRGSCDLLAPAANSHLPGPLKQLLSSRGLVVKPFGRGQLVLVAVELRTSELRGFGGLDGGMQSPGGCWRPQSRHPSVRYLWQKALFSQMLLGKSLRRQDSPAVGVGVPSLQPGIVPLSHPQASCAASYAWTVAIRVPFPEFAVFSFELPPFSSEGLMAVRWGLWRLPSLAPAGSSCQSAVCNPCVALYRGLKKKVTVTWLHIFIFPRSIPQTHTYACEGGVRLAEAVFLGCEPFVLRGCGASRPNGPFNSIFFLFEGAAGCQTAAAEFVFLSVSMNITWAYLRMVHPSIQLGWCPEQLSCSEARFLKGEGKHLVLHQFAQLASDLVFRRAIWLLWKDASAQCHRASLQLCIINLQFRGTRAEGKMQDMGPGLWQSTDLSWQMCWSQWGGVVEPFQCQVIFITDLLVK